MNSKQILETQKENQAGSKKGGPYTEQQKSERQNKVFQLHFEKGYSAVRIAAELGINRNTVNSDIKKGYLHLTDELPDDEVGALFLSQLHTLRAQKARLVDSLEKQSEQKNMIQYERLISDIDWKIGQMILKLMPVKYRENKIRYFSKDDKYTKREMYL